MQVPPTARQVAGTRLVEHLAYISRHVETVVAGSFLDGVAQPETSLSAQAVATGKQAGGLRARHADTEQVNDLVTAWDLVPQHPADDFFNPLIHGAPSLQLGEFTGRSYVIRQSLIGALR